MDYLAKRRLDNLNKESDVRIVKLVETKFTSKAFDKHWKANLLKFPYHIDVEHCLYVEVPYSKLKDSDDVEQWLTELTFNWVDGFYYLLGRCKEYGRINNLYQVPLLRFRLRSGLIKVNWMELRKKGGTSQLRRPYWFPRHLKDLKKYKYEDDIERWKMM